MLLCPFVLLGWKLQDIVPLESIFGEAARNIDPLEMLHPLERMGEKDGAGVIREFYPLELVVIGIVVVKE